MEEDQALRPESTELPEEGVVCTACVVVNEPHADYCTSCGAPLNSLVAFNPFDQTLVEGFAYRRAVDGPRSKVILLGMWSSFGPGLITAPLVFVFGRNADGSLQAGSPSTELVIWCVYFCISAAILYRTTSNYLTKRQPRIT